MYHIKNNDKDIVEDIKWLRAVTLEIQLKDSVLVNGRRRLDQFDVESLGDLLDEIGSMSINQARQILGDDAFPMSFQ